MNSLSIIWDTTLHCPWDCSICCMGATSDRTCVRNELSLSQKLAVVQQIAEVCENGYNVRTDLSGGEIFTNTDEHKKVIRALSDVLGKDKVGVSCSGYGIDKELAEFLGETVSDVEMTMDVVPHRRYKLRPTGYSVAAAKAVSKLKEAGCKVGIQTVVSTYNSDYMDAMSVFSWACVTGVDNWSLLRFFPSGRGNDHPEAAMTNAQCEEFVRMVREMVDKTPARHKPEVDFHYLMPGHKKHTDVCRCVRHSIGILPNGDVVSCFWALDSATGAISPKFFLGNVKEQSLLEILNSEKAHYWSDCLHHCELLDDSGTAHERSEYGDVLSA